jgi:hypothetical protein
MQTSLTSYIKLSAVKTALASIQPKFRKTIKRPLLVPKVSKSHMLVGTAFDYLLRINMKLRNPAADLNLLAAKDINFAPDWWTIIDIVENGFAVSKDSVFPDRMKKLSLSTENCVKDVYVTDENGERKFLCSLDELIEDCKDYSQALENSLNLGGKQTANSSSFGVDGADTIRNDYLIISTIRQFRDESIQVVQDYIEGAASLPELANACCHMALLDVLHRSNKYFPANFNTIDFSVEEKEILDLLQVVPKDFYEDRGGILLNPTLGLVHEEKRSQHVLGADADIINGSILIDIKTVSNCTVTSDILNQLLGYFILCREKRRNSETFPNIERVGVYFSRHGFLWDMSTEEWLNHPEFSVAEKTFLSLYKNRAV